MLKVDRTTGKLIKMAEPSLTSAGWEERSALQELILSNADAFFQDECKETLFILRDEVEPSPEVGDRIDLLAIDGDGKSVIIELKRGNHKLQLLQSLSYAAMISSWQSEQFELQVPEAKRTQFEEFITENELESINERQRIILIAESFDYEVLATAKWLTTFDLSITCYKLQLAQEDGNGAEYLSVVLVFPPRELASEARQRSSLRNERTKKFFEIEQLLPDCENPEISAYFKQCITQSAPQMRRNRRRDSLVYPATGQMRFLVKPKSKYARVNQWGRFDGDVAFWTENLTNATLTSNSTSLRFRLYANEDLAAFKSFVTTKLTTVTWSKSAPPSSSDIESD